MQGPWGCGGGPAVPTSWPPGRSVRMRGQPGAQLRSRAEARGRVAAQEVGTRPPQARARPTGTAAAPAAHVPSVSLGRSPDEATGDGGRGQVTAGRGADFPLGASASLHPRCGVPSPGRATAGLVGVGSGDPALTARGPLPSLPAPPQDAGGLSLPCDFAETRVPPRRGHESRRLG